MDSGLPAGLSRVDVAPGISAIDMDIPSCRARIVEQGAHITAWTPTGHDPVIFTSERAAYAPGKAIRGGIPLCLPWFGGGATGDRKPSHGYARISPWRLEAARVDGDVAEVRFAFDSREVPDATEDFAATLTARFGADLAVELTVDARADLAISEALHSYLSVTDVRGVEITGLEGAEYFDKLTADTTSDTGPLHIEGPTDRVYVSSGDVQVRELGGRTITVSKQGSAHTVVWNPWEKGALSLDDLDDAEWTGFVCVEAANVAPPVALRASQSHTLGARISLDTGQ